MIGMVRNLIAALYPQAPSELDRELRRERARYHAEAAGLAATIRKASIDKRSLLMEEMIRHPEARR